MHCEDYIATLNLPLGKIHLLNIKTTFANFGLFHTRIWDLYRFIWWQSRQRNAVWENLRSTRYYPSPVQTQDQQCFLFLLFLCKINNFFWRIRFVGCKHECIFARCPMGSCISWRATICSDGKGARNDQRSQWGTCLVHWLSPEALCNG